MPKERNKTDGYREKAYEGDTKAMNEILSNFAPCKQVANRYDTKCV